MDVKYFTDEQIKKALATGLEEEVTRVPASDQWSPAVLPALRRVPGSHQAAAQEPGATSSPG